MDCSMFIGWIIEIINVKFRGKIELGDIDEIIIDLGRLAAEHQDEECPRCKRLVGMYIFVLNHFLALVENANINRLQEQFLGEMTEGAADKLRQALQSGSFYLIFYFDRGYPDFEYCYEPFLQVRIIFEVEGWPYIDEGKMLLN